jgi:hypothetical protein
MISSKTTLKRIHVLGTIWFVTCAIFLLSLALHQAGFKWWVVFSFSGYSLVFFLFFVNIYVFAIFRGVSRHQTILEHPLTTSAYYIVLYDVSPFLGSVAGFLCSITLPELGILGILSTVAEGTLTFTFLVWIVFDPLLGFIENLLPQCAQHRKQRLEAEAEQKRLKEEEKQQLLASLEQKEAQDIRLWNQTLEPTAGQLAELLSRPHLLDEQAHRTIVQAGAQAWQLGGIICMRHLHQMVLNKTGQIEMDYLALWWDGIGTWQKPHFSQLVSARR